MTGDRRRRRQIGRVVIVIAAVLVAGGVTAAATGFGLPSGEQPARSNLPPATEKVSRQTLVDTQTEDGELGYGDPITLSSRLAGTITALPAVGAVVQRGQAIFHVDDKPAVLLYGTLPAYRGLSSGLTGTDVKQFEQNLAALGYTGFTVDDKYTASTADAVRQWQDDLGLPETGTVELGRVVYAAGPVRVDAQTAAVGDEAQPGKAVLDHTGTARVVTVDLAVSDQRLAVKDAAVSLTLPDGRKAAGKITRTRTVIDTGSGNGQDEPETKIEVTVTVDDEAALSGLDQASVGVGFTASQRENVLTVPVGALLALAEGGYGVQIVDGAGTRIVAVQTGLFAGGRVEVSGDGLAEGATVGMPG